VQKDTDDLGFWGSAFVKAAHKHVSEIDARGRCYKKNLLLA